MSHVLFDIKPNCICNKFASISHVVCCHLVLCFFADGKLVQMMGLEGKLLRAQATIGSRPSITPLALIASCTGEDQPNIASCLPGPPEIQCEG